MSKEQVNAFIIFLSDFLTNFLPYIAVKLKSKLYTVDKRIPLCLIFKL